MSSIAMSVGGSKTTLWKCFRSKDELFGAVVSQLAQELHRALTIDLQADESPLVVLRQFARAILATLLSPSAISLHRMVIAEAIRFPHLADLYFEFGPRRCIAQLADFLALSMERGTIRSGDPAVAARQFVALCKAGRYERALLGLGPSDHWVSTQEIDEIVGPFLLGWVDSPARIDLYAARHLAD